MTARARLPERRHSENFTFEVDGLRYTATVAWFPDGRIGELFLSNHKSNSAADTNARDAAITFSIAVQHGADPEVIRRALSRDSRGLATGPLGRALDLLAELKPDGPPAADRPTFTRRLREPNVEPVRALRRLLKTMLHRLCFRCAEIRQDPAHTQLNPRS